MRMDDTTSLNYSALLLDTANDVDLYCLFIIMEVGKGSFPIVLPYAQAAQIIITVDTRQLF